MSSCNHADIASAWACDDPCVTRWVCEATDLDDLLVRLRAAQDEAEDAAVGEWGDPDSALADVMLAERLCMEELPTFGGERPEAPDDCGSVWSYDADRLLVGGGAHIEANDILEIVRRKGGDRMKSRSGQIGDVLRHAAQLIEREGWVQGDVARDASGQPCSPYGPVAGRCAYGAIIAAALRVATVPEEDACLIAVAANESVQSELRRDNRLYCVTNWNDRPGRTASEVTALLRRVAEGGNVNEP